MNWQTVCAIVFALLITLSLVAIPVNASPPDSAGAPDRSGTIHDGKNAPSPAEDSSEPEIRPPAIEYQVDDTVELHEVAIDELDQIDAEAASDEEAAIAHALNDSAAAYSDAMFVSSAEPLDHKIEAQERLSTLAATHDANESAVDATSEIVVDAGNLTARFMVRAASAALDAQEGSFENRGQRASTEKALDNAIDALERGDDARSTDAPRRGPPTDELESTVRSRQNALTHYRTAVQHANRAFERIENISDPTLSLAAGTVYEDDGTAAVPVQVELTAVRPYLYGEAEISITETNGSEATNEPIALQTSWTDTTNASANTVLDVGSESGNATVAVDVDSDGLDSLSETITVSVDEADLERSDPRTGTDELRLTDDESGVQVELSGEDLLPHDFSVTNQSVPPSVDDEYRVAPVVRIQNRTAIDTADVIIPLSEEIEADDNVSVFGLDPANERGWERVDTHVDVENQTATGTVDSFSFFTVFDEAEWRDYRTTTITLDDRHVEQRLAVTDSAGAINESVQPGEEIWSFAPKDRRFFGSSPTVVDESVYVVEGLGTMYALDAETGDVEWSNDFPDYASHTDVAKERGMAFVADGDLHAVDAESGEVEWTFDDVFLGTTQGSPATLDGAVFVRQSSWSEDDEIYALDARSGEVLWNFSDPDDRSLQSPILGDDRLYVATSDNTLLALDAATGDVLWENQRVFSLSHWPPTEANGTVYTTDIVPEQGLTITALDAETGVAEWTNDDLSAIQSPPTVADGTLYVGGDNDTTRNEDGGTIFAINAETGETEWSSTGPQATVSTAPTVADSTLYVLDNGQSLYALDAYSGTKEWRYERDSSFVLSNPTVARGAVFFGDWSSALRAISANTTSSSEDSRVRYGTYGQIGEREQRTLPAGADPVQGTDDAVLLRDSNGDGIPDAVADADPPLPWHALGAALLGHTGYEERDPGIGIDPLLVDTDGDGLPDNREIDGDYRVFEEDGEIRLEARVDRAISDPSAYDTDGDGLSDAEEVDEWGTNPRLADTAGDGLVDPVDPVPTEETYPPQFEYVTWNMLDKGGSTLIAPSLDLAMPEQLGVFARPVGTADEIEEISIDLYFDTWIPLGPEGWQNETITQESFQETDGEQVYAETSFTDYSKVTPERVALSVTDDLGSRVEVNHDVDEGVVEIATGVAPSADKLAALPLIAGTEKAAAGGAVASKSTAKVVTLSAGTAAITAAGITVGVGGSFAIMLETVGSVEGEVDEVEFVQAVPATTTVGERWEENGLEILLPSGGTVEDLDIDREPKWGWEQVVQLPGIHEPQDVGDRIDGGEVIRDRGDYDVVIGEHSDVLFWIYQGFVLFAEQTVEQEEVAEGVSERVDEQFEDGETVTKEDVEDAMRNEPDEEASGPRYTTETYQIAEQAARLVLRIVGEQIVDYAVERVEEDDRDDRCSLDATDVDMRVQSINRGQFDAADSGFEEFRGTFDDGVENPVATNLRCVDDRDAVVQTYADDPSDLSDGSLGENVTMELIDERGLDLRFPQDGFEPGVTSDKGPDAIAYDETTDEWVIIEAKMTQSTEAVGIGLLETDAYEGDPQLSDPWIENSLEELNSTDRVDPTLVKDVQDALDEGNVRKEIVFVRDVQGASDRTLRRPNSPSTDITIPDVVGVDGVTIVELQAGDTDL